MTTILPINRPPLIDGDAALSAPCTHGACSSEKQCSGGYGCEDSSDSGQSGGNSRCLLRPINEGRENKDLFIDLTPNQIKEQTTDAWRVEMDYFPIKPIVNTPNL